MWMAHRNIKNERNMAEKDLARLCQSLTPRLQLGEYVFCTLNEQACQSLPFQPLCTFREEEGVSVIISRNQADALSLPYTQVWAWITCEVHSDLTAVGFLAAMTRILAEAGISVNAVSAYHHDHLFVLAKHAHKAMDVLQQFQQESRNQ